MPRVHQDFCEAKGEIRMLCHLMEKQRCEDGGHKLSHLSPRRGSGGQRS